MKINFKSFVSGILIGITITASISAFAVTQLNVKPNPYPVLIDGEVADVDGYNINASTYLKLGDLEQVGVGVKFENKQILLTSSNQTEENMTKGGEEQLTTTALPDLTVPEINDSNKYLNPIRLVDGDNFQLTKFGDYTAIIYNSNTYILSTEFSKKTKITEKFNGKNNTVKLYKDNTVILETEDANPINFIFYSGYLYFNINFLGKNLEN